MTSLFEILSSAWSQALGWTIVHSLWQSLIIFLLILTLHRFISSKSAHTRYVIAVSGLALLCMTSTVTFLYTYSQIIEVTNPTIVTYHFLTTEMEAATHTNDSSVLHFLQINMPFVVASWLIGTFIFVLRVAGGWWYVQTLRRQSIPVNNNWLEKINSMSYALGIRQWIELAISEKVSTPVVLGYMKPIVLVPVGIFTGLTPQQVETVLLHELMHIKRNDYIINLIQSFLEAVYFFNPFVWILSSTIRREREHCCDDAVVATYPAVKDYAYALAKLEEVRLDTPSLALSLSRNKYQLLYRIRRIMEKSAEKYPARERLIPVILLAVGLICASWLTIQSDNRNESELREDRSGIPATVVADTTKKEKKARYTKKKIITTDENGKPKEEVIEEFEGDEELKELIETTQDFDFHFDLTLPDFNMPPHMMMDSVYEFNFRMDSLPPFDYRWREQFNAEFEKAFRENFSDFYNSHQQEMEKMMEDIHQRFNNEQWQEKLEEQMKDMHERLEETQLKLQKFSHEDFAKAHEEHLLAAQRRMQEVHEKMKAEEIKMKIMETRMRELEESQVSRAREMEVRMKAMEQNMKEFEGALKDELIKDGYIKKNEKLTTIHWHNGSLEVNGQKIKPAHEKKYNNLRKKYIND